MTSDVPFEQDSALRGFADEHGLSVAAARSLLDALRAQVGADRLYVFWNAGRGAGADGAGGAGRQRMLLAFTTPDAALAFAQRNQLAHAGEPARLRRLTLLQLIQAVLRAPAISALLIADDGADEQTPVGQLPVGIRIARADLLRQLEGND
jgi:hypothetical protein